MSGKIKIVLILRIVLSIEVLIITAIFALAYLEKKATPLLVVVLVASWLAYILLFIKSKKLLNFLNDLSDSELDEFMEKKNVSDYANIEESMNKKKSEDASLEDEDNSVEDDKKKSEEKETSGDDKKSGKDVEDEWNKILYDK